MLGDVLGSLAATLAFTAILYTPGYLLAWAADLFGFRRQPFAERSRWAIGCSFLLSPLLAYLLACLLGKRTGLPAICGVFWLTAAGAALLCWRDRRLACWSPHEQRITALIAAGWTTLVLLLLVDFQVGHKLYFSVVMADQSYRIAFTDAVVRSGVPPANPLYFAGAPAPMRYYYFWYVLCAAVVRMAHVSARQAFIASSIWAGFGLLAVTHLFTTHFFRWSRRKRWLAMGLLLVSGADLIPAIGQALLQPTLNGDTEWWSVDPIDSWPDSLLWVPHHVASVLCCLLAFLLLWPRREATPASRRWAVLLAALGFGSAVGLSVYVAFGFLLMAGAWLVWLLLRREPQALAILRQALAAALLSALLLSPFLRELLAGPHSHQANPTVAQSTPGPVFALSVRRMIDSGLITGLPALRSWNARHPVLLDQAIRLVLLLPGLAMELGLYGVVLVLAWRSKQVKHHGSEAIRSARFLTTAGLLFTMFLTSSVISNNDFGYRAVMLPQFFLLLLTADLVGSWWFAEDPAWIAPTPGRRRLAMALLGLGIAGQIYWAVLLRAWLPFEAAHLQTGYARSPVDEFDFRRTFEAFDRIAPKDAVLAFRPIDPIPDRQGAVMVPNEYYQRMLVMDAGRQLLNAEEKCATHFGGDPAPCPAIQKAVQQLYAFPVPDGAEARSFCAHFGVHFLVVSSWDPAWTSSRGWPVALPVVAGDGGIRILRCDGL